MVESTLYRPTENYQVQDSVQGLKVPPHSIEAEQAVLGGLMLDNRAWEQIADLITEVDFYRRDHRLIFRSIANLEATEQPFDVVTLSEQLGIFTWLELQQKPIPIVLGLIIIVAIFNIVGAVLMLIIQKTGAIGILRSMGASGKQIIQIFIFQGITLAIVGILIGNLLALLLSWLQNEFKIIELPEQIYYLSNVPISINIETYFIVSILGLILSLFASLIPSYIASRIRPITAIKFN